ncbi:hypothetical protein STEG23_026881 [Scotinomys teguina]
MKTRCRCYRLLNVTVPILLLEQCAYKANQNLSVPFPNSKGFGFCCSEDKALLLSKFVTTLSPQQASVATPLTSSEEGLRKPAVRGCNSCEAFEGRLRPLLHADVLTLLHQGTKNQSAYLAFTRFLFWFDLQHHKDEKAKSKSSLESFTLSFSDFEYTESAPCYGNHIAEEAMDPDLSLSSGSEYTHCFLLPTCLCQKLKLASGFRACPPPLVIILWPSV